MNKSSYEQKSNTISLYIFTSNTQNKSIVIQLYFKKQENLNKISKMYLKIPKQRKIMIDQVYLWIVIVGGCASFFASMGVGANDVANAFATSVGSKTLTIKQAMIIASICECSGAILMGSHVAETIRKGISDYKCFVDAPAVLMYGCMCVLFAVGIWLFIASYFEMPVSTTHSCVGGMIGMTIVAAGPNCVIWYEYKETFPYYKGRSIRNHSLLDYITSIIRHTIHDYFPYSKTNSSKKEKQFQ